MKPKQPPPLIVPKDKPYHFTGWTWKNGKWTPTFQERLKAKRKRKEMQRDQSKRIHELDELLNHAIEK